MEKDKEEINGPDGTEESFEDLLNESFVEPMRFSPGEKIEVLIVQVTKEWAFIDTGGKSEGFIDINEFLDDEGNVTVKEGDRVSAYFLRSKNNERMFTTRISSGAVGSKILEDAYSGRIPVEGSVEKEIKGGYQVKVGGIRAFCPYSQMALSRVEDPEKFIGETMTFMVIEYGEGGRNVIVSHRAILEEERQKQKDELKETLKEGMTVSGEITSVRDFGAFVDIGGIEGLIPISEISWGRVEDVKSYLSVGQKVDIAIVKLDWEKDRYSFSLKEIMPDPWTDVIIKYPAESTHKGMVARLAAFGAFITLEPGVDGLLHISELGKGKKIKHPREVIEEGQTVEVRIGKIEEEKRRISLSMVSDDDDSAEDDNYRKHVSTSGDSSSGSFGTLGDMLKKLK